MRRALKSTLIGGALAILVSGGGAFATGGAGGMGGGGARPADMDKDLPGSSGPRYDPAVEYAKAVAALKAQQYKEAAKAAEHVTDAVPKNPGGWQILGAAKAGANDWKGSRKAYEKALKLAPDDFKVHAGLGLALANLKDPKAQAEVDWLNAKAQACGDTCADAASLKAVVGVVQSAMNPAGAAPKPSAMLDHSMLFGGAKAGDAAYVKAVSLINERRYDEALASLSQAEATFGPHPDILTYQGYTWRKKGDYAKAEGYYQQALAIDPKHIGATEYYGELKAARGDIAGARLMLARLDKLCAFGCADAEELRRWIDAGGDPQKN